MQNAKANRLRSLIWVSIYFLLFSLSSIAAFADGNIPAACQTECKTEYGKLLGTDAKGVPAFSNCKSNCVVFSPNKLNGIYTGIQWQCVEYARRWLLNNYQVVYGDVDIAADIWKLDHVNDPSTKAQFVFSSFVNGSKQAPQFGDLLIYGKEFLNTGHVAVVIDVDQQNRSVKVAEQNFNNEQWPGNYARTIPFVVENGKYWILDSYLIGWKRVIK